MQIQSGLGPLKMTLAEETDKAAILNIVRDAAVWLKERGIDQWQSTLKENFEPLVEQRIRSGSVYLAWLGDEAVATVRIEWEDSVFWGERGRDGVAGYVHGLAVARNWAGRRLG